MKSIIAAAAALLIAPLISASAVPRSGSPLTQAQAQSQLQAAGIYASSSGGCTAKSNPTCTSYDGILSGTVNGVITLKNACGCAITVTGGTETGHASGTYSHANGYKVDLAKATALNNYITNSFTRIANRSDGYPQWQAASGNIYCDEGNHWDITYY
ncbi:hypothetical protein BOTBODRAFT_345768 [Botryobasidium botryosum FD-172 SS1]|uniref:Peptidoglycan-binding domain 1 protein n=1 Tax=Botryobasidium botryosum (strain FD-172 SS1) TaxID=930990 RepID=A0A067MIJ8_BOTB1|nr:hypothetical protein BOTBODRAFT_345768 [Botryobasidium botryosum FD-172 SS1]